MQKKGQRERGEGKKKLATPVNNTQNIE